MLNISLSQDRMLQNISQNKLSPYMSDVQIGKKEIKQQNERPKPSVPLEMEVVK